ncbi:MAG: HNH endonuclease [Candidatus Krumholzibacteriia bacterium]
MEVHHRTPRAQGGNHDAANLVTLCASCHRL